MYSLEQKQYAIDMIIRYKSIRAAYRQLDYPGSRETLRKWYCEYLNGDIIAAKYKMRAPKYNTEQVDIAVEYYLNHGMNITKTVNDLGYPCRSVLSRWIDERFPDKDKHVLKGSSLLKYSYNEKVEAVTNLCCREEPVSKLVEKEGISSPSLYKWKRQLLPRSVNTMDKSSKTDSLSIIELEEKAMKLQKQVHKLQVEKDALEKATEIIKKAQGINLQKLSNSEKAIIIDALRCKYCLTELLTLFKMSKSSYFYQRKAHQKDEKYSKVRKQIVKVFADSGETYGYRRIYAMLRRQCIYISEKVVRRIMKEEHLHIKKVKVRKYSSYKGEISPAVPNIIKRNFHADKPNEKWLTDVTEFHIPAGKVYLSPIIDCFDGLPVAWTIGTSPSAELVNTMLDIAIEQLPQGTHPIIHSDRGSHYRWPGWIKRMKSAQLVRSMSKKGCSPDNAACEGFFGRLKNEMFYCRSWNNVTIEEFIDILDLYIKWYSTKRIKMSLGAMSPMEYRRSLGLVS